MDVNEEQTTALSAQASKDISTNRLWKENILHCGVLLFKPNTRWYPWGSGFDIIDALEAEGATVSAFDPGSDEECEDADRW